MAPKSEKEKKSVQKPVEENKKGKISNSSKKQKEEEDALPSLQEFPTGQ